MDTVNTKTTAGHEEHKFGSWIPMSRFKELSGKTEAVKTVVLPNTIFDKTSLEHRFEVFLEHCKYFDDAKKYLAYGNIPDELRDLHVNLSEGRPGLVMSDRYFAVLHAVLGKISELAELIEALYKVGYKPNTFGGCNPLVSLNIARNLADVDKINVGEELADEWWYDMILCRTFDLPPERLMFTNIAKLQERYPNKFNPHDAVNRNLRRERDALEGKYAEPGANYKAPEKNTDGSNETGRSNV